MNFVGLNATLSTPTVEWDRTTFIWLRQLRRLAPLQVLAFLQHRSHTT